MFQVGEQLHNQRYEILRPLGQGGFSQTFEVDDNGTLKVLKVLSESYPKAVDLFQREFKVLSQLRHPGIPLVEADGYFTVMPAAVANGAIAQDPSEPYHCLIMERVPGSDLRQWVRQQDHHPLSQDLALDWLTQLAEILVQLHQHHCFHRDIKPSNIMLRPDGQLVLIDFGAVREVTETFLHKQNDDVTSTHLYSRGYTPMEQMQGRAVPQSDFFALGRTFVHLLTGCNPLDFSTDFETGELLWRDYAPHVSEVLADLIDRLMAPFVAKRPTDPDHLLAEILAVKTVVTNSTDRPTVLPGCPPEGESTEIPLEFLTESLPGPINRLDAQLGGYPRAQIDQDRRDDSSLVSEPERYVPSTDQSPPTPAPYRLSQKLGIAGLCSLLATVGIMGVRLLGLLQGMELTVFDQMMRSRFSEPLDDRLVFVTVGNDDITYQDEQGFERQGSLADEALAQLLMKLEPHSPRVIGVDIYRPVHPRSANANEQREGTQNFNDSGNLEGDAVAFKDSVRDVLRRFENLVVVCEIGGGQQDLPAIAPPPEVPLERVGFSNIPYDVDQRVRRQLVGMSPDKVCDTGQSLSTQLVAGYLASENLEIGADNNGVVYIGDRLFPPILGRIGGFQHPSILREGGYQLLVNYRANPDLAPSYGLSAILSGELDRRLSDIVADRIVLVGTTERSYNDYHLTPYGEMAGVVVQGHMTSQILSAVLDDRPLLWGFPIWGDGLWILGWASLIGGLVVVVRSPWLKIGIGIVGIISLTGTSFILLLYGGWMPLVPSVGAIALTGLGLKYWPRLSLADSGVAQHPIKNKPPD